MQSTIKNLKNADQDFEFYPTTTEQLQLVRNDISKTFKSKSRRWRDPNVIPESILDIGAGDGRALKTLTDTGTRYAIEKSNILINKIVKIDNTFIIGTDFYQQSLIDKEVDIIFCNPPYTVFENWIATIIKTSNCKVLYFIVPERWKNSQLIEDALASRNVKAELLSESNFSGADREARGTVNIVKVDYDLDINQFIKDGRKRVKDSFNVFFEENFTGEEKTSVNRYADLMGEYDNELEAQDCKNELVQNDGLVNVLERFYNRDLENIFEDYKRISELDQALLLELGVDTESVKETLKMKLKTTKRKYWDKLFNNLDVIKNRFTQEQRRLFIDNFSKHTSVDFTISNCHAVIVWAIEQANGSRDTMIVNTMDSLTHNCDVLGYKSNERLFVRNKHRYNNGDDPYKLDYRLISEYAGKVEPESYQKRLSERAQQTVFDLKIIASLIGFGLDTEPDTREYFTGQTYQWYFIKDGQKEILFEAKYYKKGSVHFKFNKEFLMRINVEMGRIKGWVYSQQDVQDEFDVDAETASKLISNHLTNQIQFSNMKLLK